MSQKLLEYISGHFIMYELCSVTCRQYELLV